MTALALAIGASAANAQTEPSELQPLDDPPGDASPSAPADVQYGAVDAATVRVFAVGPVNVDSFLVDDTKIHFAITNAGHGTGFAVGSGRMIATAKHVVDGALHVVVRRPGDGGYAPARVIYVGDDADVAILAIEDATEPLKLAPDATGLRVRATAFAVGYPLDPTRKFAQSVRGIISGSLDDGTVQIDMDINPGNSGGPLLDADDRVIGMVVARAVASVGAQGIGYAVPIAKVADAVRKAEAALAATPMVATTAAERKSAQVVDELIQSGALRSLRDAGDLEGGLQGKNLERGLDDISRDVDDPDLLAFIAGNLWNASLVLRYGDVEKIGDHAITQAEARSLASRLAREAVRLSNLAYERDSGVAVRSAFVDFARARVVDRSGQHVDADDTWASPAPAAEPYRGVPVRAWLGYTFRINPSTGSSGGGAVGGGAIGLTRFEQRRLIPLLGASIGGASVDSTTTAGESYAHVFVALELGAVARLSDQLELGAAYAPGFYVITATAAGDRSIGDAAETVLAHAHGWASAVLGNFTLTAGVRVLSGPTFWFEPIALGVAF